MRFCSSDGTSQSSTRVQNQEPEYQKNVYNRREKDRDDGEEEEKDECTKALHAQLEPVFTNGGLRHKEEEECCQWLKARYILAVLLCMGTTITSGMRSILSMTMVAMVNNTAISLATNVSDDSECSAPTQSSLNETALPYTTGDINWDETQQGFVLSAFFYGYVLLQLPGGWLAARFGAKHLIGFCILNSSVFTLLTPLAAGYSIYATIAVRAVEGLFEGVLFPGLLSMWGEWAPVWERSRLIGISTIGSTLATVISLPIAGMMCDTDFLGGWPSVFYLFGILGCLWFVVWCFFAFNTPAQHPRISQAERKYIEASIGKKRQMDTPWKCILTSPAIWSIVSVHVSCNWLYYTMLTSLPLFMNSVLNFGYTMNGILSGLPYLVGILLQTLTSFIADYVREHGHLSTKQTRTVINAVGLIIPPLLLIGTGFVGCNPVASVLLITLSLGLSSVLTVGFLCNIVDIAPRHAGVIMGISNSIGAFPGLVCPVFVGYLTSEKSTAQQWLIMFYITLGLGVAGALIFAVFAKGEIMPWAVVDERELTSPKVDPDKPYKQSLMVEVGGRTDDGKGV